MPNWYQNHLGREKNNRYLASLLVDVWVPDSEDDGLEIEQVRDAIRTSFNEGEGSLNNGAFYNTRLSPDIKVERYG